MTTFRNDVKEAARGRWPELLVSIGGISHDLLDKRHHPCPRRCIGGGSNVPGGRDRFRLIDEDAGAVLCSVCFSSKNGDGFAAIGWMLGIGFADVLALVAGRLGIKRKAKAKKKPEVLRFEQWRPDRADWCDKKGISQAIVREEGGKMADWHSQRVIAFPILGTTAGSKPRGWAIVNAMGGTLRSRSGEAKILVTTGSKTGWIGKASLARLEGARVIWKVEGVTDQLALSQAIPEADRPRNAVLTNPFGSTENPKANLIEVFRGKLVAVIHDLDDAGQAGALKWATAIAAVAKEVRIVRLPDKYDLREWLHGAIGGTFDELRRLARTTEIIAINPKEVRPAGRQEKDEPSLDGIEEEEDDEVSLARLYIRQRAQRFLIHQGAPHTWTDQRWSRASTHDELDKSVIEFIEQEYNRLALLKAELAKKKDEDPPKRKKITYRTTAAVSAMVRRLASIPPDIQYGSMLERDDEGIVISSTKRNMVAFKNTLVDLDELLANGPEKATHAHTPDWWSLVKLPYDFDASAEIGPHWSSFLRINLDGDEKLIACLQEWMGYCLLPNTDHHKFLMLIGEGANGKSVFCAVLEALLGEDNVSHIPIELFGQRFQLTPSLGKLANIATETSALDKIAEGHLKQYTDGSKMVFDRKGLSGLEARPTAKVILATNRPPRFSDKSMGLWRRMLVAPFTVEIKDEDRILGLDKPDWWLGRRELPGIFNWTLEGLKRLSRNRDFTIPDAAVTVKEELRQDNSPAREFVLESYVFSDGEWTARSEMYSIYRKFCEASGYKPLGERLFSKEVVSAIPGLSVSRRGSRGNQARGFLNLMEHRRYELVEG